MCVLAVNQQFCSSWNSNLEGFLTEAAGWNEEVSQPLNIAVASRVVVELRNNYQANTLQVEERREQAQVWLLLALFIFRGVLNQSLGTVARVGSSTWTPVQNLNSSNSFQMFIPSVIDQLEAF